MHLSEFSKFLLVPGSNIQTITPTPMANSILEKIHAIEEEAQKKIAALRSEAVSEIAKSISQKKAELAELEAEYLKLTGKDIKGQKTEAGRKRLSTDQKAKLVCTVTEIISAAKEGIGMGDIVKQAGESVSAVRSAVKQVKGIKSTGAKASTLYFLK